MPIDGVIAVIGQAGEDWQAVLAAANGGAAAPAANGQPSTPVAAPVTEAPAAAASTEDSRVKASPLAKSIAKETGVSLAQVTGSGDQGRIVKKDVEAFLEGKGTAPAVVAPTPAATPTPTPAPTAKAEAPASAPFAFNSGGNNYEEVGVSQMRKVIARRLGESLFTAPHFYLTIEINMDRAIEMRKQLNEVSPVKLSFNDLVVKAVAASLTKHPAINSSWLGDKIRYNKDINIGVAVAVEDGLLVPVIRYANMKTMSQINTEVKALAGKAKERKLQPDEMQGNTFTISNLGMFGIDEFTAIINPPDACILAVGGIFEKPIVKNGEIVVGNTMKVTLSCDHRVVDGATGAQFLQSFKEIMEEPIKLLV